MHHFAVGVGLRAVGAVDAAVRRAIIRTAIRRAATVGDLGRTRWRTAAGAVAEFGAHFRAPISHPN